MSMDKAIKVLQVPERRLSEVEQEYGLKRLEFHGTRRFGVVMYLTRDVEQVAEQLKAPAVEAPRVIEKLPPEPKPLRRYKAETRSQYIERRKQQAMQLHEEEGLSWGEVARTLSISRVHLWRWRQGRSHQ